MRWPDWLEGVYKCSNDLNWDLQEGEVWLCVFLPHPSYGKCPVMPIVLESTITENAWPSKDYVMELVERYNLIMRDATLANKAFFQNVMREHEASRKLQREKSKQEYDERCRKREAKARKEVRLKNKKEFDKSVIGSFWSV
jgi:hypothetical protein